MALIICLTSVFLGTVNCGVHAQERKMHDVSVAYGVFPILDERYFWDGDQYESIGVFSAQYVFNISKIFGIGALLGYHHYKNRHSIDNYTANDFTGMFIIRANWIDKPNFTLFSKAGIGRRFCNDNGNKESNYSKTAVIIPFPSIGMTFSISKGIFALTEFSLLSSEGIFSFGAGYRF